MHDEKEKATLKAINFDLDTKELEKVFNGNTSKPYEIIKKFMHDNGFEHRQYSGYLSTKKLTEAETTVIIKNLREKNLWLDKCIQKIDMTDVGKSFDLSFIFIKNKDKDVDINVEDKGNNMDKDDLKNNNEKNKDDEKGNDEKNSLDNFSIKITSLENIHDDFKNNFKEIFKVGEEVKGENAQNLLQTLATTDMMLKENYLKKGQISLDKIGVNFQINDKKFNLDLPFGQGVFSKNFNEILQLHTNDLTPNFLNEKETKGYYEIIERFGKRKDDKTKVKSNLEKTTENVIDFGIDSGLSLANSLDEDIGELAKGFESAFKTFHQIQTPELKNEVKNNDSKKNNIDDFTKDFLKKVSSGEIKIGTEAKKEHSIHKEKDKGR